MSADPPSGERSLVERAAAGQRAAFDELYARHVRPVYWQAYSHLRDPDDAEEVTQDTFVTAWRKLRQIDLVGGSLLPWLLVTARYTAANKRRQRLRHHEHTTELDHEPRDPSPSLSEQVEADELAAAIAKSVTALAPSDQELVALCIQDGRTYAEAAQALGVSHGAVRNRVSRIRQRLRADLRAVRGVA